MSSWLGYTKKMLGSAISTIAQELEQTVVDFNDAVQVMGQSRETSNAETEGNKTNTPSFREQHLARESQELPKGPLTLDEHPEEQQITAATRQVATRTYLHSMSTWPTTCLPPSFITTQPKPSDSNNSSTQEESLKGYSCNSKVLKLSSDEEGSKYDKVNNHKALYAAYEYDTGCRYHRKGVLRMRLGEKRPGKVIRATSAESDKSQSGTFSPGNEILLASSVDRQSRVNESNRLLAAGTVDSSNSQALVPYSASGEAQVSPKWLGFFTFALAQVTSAVWMILDEPPRTSVASALSRSNSPQNVPYGRSPRKKSSDLKQQYLATKLEVHKTQNSSHHLRDQEDPLLLSPVSIRSTYSSESFEIIDASMAAEESEVAMLWSEYEDCQRENPDFDAYSGREPSNVKPSAQMTNSSAELINFDFSSLVSNRQWPNQSLEVDVTPQEAAGGELCTSSHDWVENHFTSDGKAPQCQCRGEGCNSSPPCTVHLYVVESDDGSSSFDVLSDPGEEEFIMF
ncbi:uncharacterized protein LOC101857839 [Aplysia californica]|uniref:Uncharacterized protein LOC101857839 n=1 Tax=Aplysia californica TaxID=6500 RepID=A0ABM0K7I9_APLCA|nr:uncharacterized protein LOC101857839 [Aplysia californica]XP_005110609.1 uncharacterized protein LOC101857839 [Aplysia californica]XP_035828814.1 uncharacterized protein LOC101857839 [Aplysia californica]